MMKTLCYRFFWIRVAQFAGITNSVQILLFGGGGAPDTAITEMCEAREDKLPTAPLKTRDGGTKLSRTERTGKVQVHTRNKRRRLD